jgi:hypothetical protein
MQSGPCLLRPPNRKRLRCIQVGGAGGVKSADRVLATVEFVADHGSVRFQDIVNGLALARSSARGLVKTLVSGGWLKHNPDRTYLLGLRAWQVGRSTRATEHWPPWREFPWTNLLKPSSKMFS